MDFAQGTVVVIVGLVIGAALGALYARARGASREAELATRLAERDREVAQARETISRAEQNAGGLREQLGRETESRAAAQQALQDEQSKTTEQLRLLDEAQQRLSDTFKAIAADSLRASNESFLQLAQERLAAQQHESKQDLEARQRAIEQILQPLQENLKSLAEQTQSLERERAGKLSSLSEQLRQLADVHQQLSRDTNALVGALRQPHVRGRWGELTLRRVVEIAGMSEFCDFDEQVTVATDDGTMRPDLVVRLPAERDIVVDAKTPLAGYLDALEAQSDEARQAALARHAQQVRIRIDHLSSRSYWSQFARSPEFAVLFLPSDAMFSAALTMEPDLLERALNNKVVIATPATLIALLRAVAYGWRQEQLTRTAGEIRDLGKSLFDRMSILADHLRNVGKRLAATVEDYNKAVGSLESRVLPAARRFKELGAVSDGQEIEVLEPISQVPRTLDSTPALPGLEEGDP